ncbi:hypothetical protein [Nonomuraea endophytica]|uniref:hypothetical protein n=1 Tax=Nonomuraea endophytica TaxID=714136 RepID=UPI0037CADBE4
MRFRHLSVLTTLLLTTALTTPLSGTATAAHLSGAAAATELSGTAAAAQLSGAAAATELSGGATTTTRLSGAAAGMRLPHAAGNPASADATARGATSATVAASGTGPGAWEAAGQPEVGSAKAGPAATADELGAVQPEAEAAQPEVGSAKAGPEATTDEVGAATTEDGAATTEVEAAKAEVEAARAEAVGKGWGWPTVLPSLRRNLVAHYDFEHPDPANPATEQDRGRSGTGISLVNGGADMRVRDGAHRGSRTSVQARQVSPTTASSDDWKAGVYSPTGVPTLNAFNAVRGATIMGWFKMTGQNPSPNSNSANPDDFYGAIGLAGVLSGNSQGHDVRALLELITVNGEMRVVALGRRVDGGSSQTFAADRPWQEILPPGEWVFLAATFDYDTATMRLYKNGRPLSGFYTLTGDPWTIEGPPEPDLASPTDPRGIKIGGSYPQNNREGNPCNCRMDSLMFLDRIATPGQVLAQYLLVARHW